MRDFNAQRDECTDSEIWLLEHSSVFTLGQAAKPEHVLDAGDIPLLQSDRGGQVTYHGPGQVIIYLLLDLRKAGLGVRGLVDVLENSVVKLLAEQGVESWPRADAPGVYVAQGKIASLGLRIRNGCSYHGLALNVDMDLAPFQRINPCGLVGQQVTQLKDLGIDIKPHEAGERLAELLAQSLNMRLQRAG